MGEHMETLISDTLSWFSLFIGTVTRLLSQQPTYVNELNLFFTVNPIRLIYLATYLGCDLSEITDDIIFAGDCRVTSKLYPTYSETHMK